MNIIIDGKTCACEKGEYLLDIAKRNSIFIPTLCNHAGLESVGACRMCIVEVVESGRSKESDKSTGSDKSTERGRGTIVVSCLYPVERECEVFTKSDTVTEQRRIILALLSKLAPSSSRIRSLCRHYEVAALPRLSSKADGDRCVLCGLCVQACKELGTGAIAAVNRGIAKEIATPYHKPSKACIGCASCAEVCPTQAIPVEHGSGTRTIWGRTFELVHCTQCGAVLDTREVLDAVAQRTGQEPETLCEPCRKHAIADALAHTYSV